MGLGVIKASTVGVLAVWAACVGLAAPVLAQDVGTESNRPHEIAFYPIGETVPATRVREMPSSMLSRHMFGRPEVLELEPGVLSTWVPKFDYPHAIFATWDGFEAFAICTKRVTVGCDVTFFDYEAQEINRYHMPLELAEKRATYMSMLTK